MIMEVTEQVVRDYSTAIMFGQKVLTSPVVYGNLKKQQTIEKNVTSLGWYGSVD